MERTDIGTLEVPFSPVVMERHGAVHTYAVMVFDERRKGGLGKGRNHPDMGEHLYTDGWNLRTE